MPDINDLQQHFSGRGPVLGFSHAYLSGKDGLYNSIREKAKKAGRLANFESDFNAWRFWLSVFRDQTTLKEFGKIFEPGGGDAAWLTERSMGLATPKINSPFTKDYIIQLFKNVAPHDFVIAAQKDVFINTRPVESQSQEAINRNAEVNGVISDLIKLVANNYKISVEQRAQVIKDVLVAPESEFTKLKLQLQELVKIKEEERLNPSPPANTGTYTVSDDLVQDILAGASRLPKEKQDITTVAILAAVFILIIIIFKKIL